MASGILGSRGLRSRMSGTAAARPSPSALAGRRSRWAALALFTALSLVCFADVFIIGALLVPIKAELRLTDEQLGRLNSAYILAFIAVVPVAGLLGDRFPRKWFIFLALGILGAATIGSGGAGSFLALLLWRALSGIGEGIFVSLMPTWLADLFEIRLRGIVFAILQSSSQFAAWIAYSVGGQVAAASSWHDAYVFVGVPTLILALGVPLLREPGRGAADGKTDHRIVKPTQAEILALFRRLDYLLYLGGYVSRMVAVGGLFYWGSLLLHRHYGLANRDAVGFMGSAYVLTGTPGIFISGIVAGWLSRNVKGAYAFSLVIGEVFAGTAVLTVLLGDFSLPWVKALLLTQMFFAGLCWGAISPLLFEIAPIRLRNLALSFAMIAQNIGSAFLAAELIGAASDRFGIAKALLIVPAGYFVAAGFWIALALRQRRRVAQHELRAAPILQSA